MKTCVNRALAALNRLDERLSRRSRFLGMVFALLFAGALAVLSINIGPLKNLNDIGGWSNRFVFIVLTAGAHAAVLAACTAAHKGRFSRLLLRETILTLGLVILLQGINQKTHFYTQEIQPLVRAMDAGGLRAAAGYDTHLSAPMILILYLLTRGPVYDMYTVKLATIFCWLLLAVLLLAFAQKKRLGWREDVLLTLCMILPQAFMNAGCTAQTDVFCLLPLAASLWLAMDSKGCAIPQMCSAVLYGLAAAMSGLAWYALPVYGYLAWKGRLEAKHLAVSAAVLLALCLPMAAAGMTIQEAAGSLFRANLSLPLYASGAPSAMSWLPRAAVEEMEEYFMLSRVPNIDPVTNAQPYYTQAHFEQVALGVTIALQAAFGALAVWIVRRNMDGASRTFALVLLALMCCPAATSGAWLAADILCLYWIVAKPRLRLPAGFVLFATAGTSAYPMLGETQLPMVYGFVLCLLALCMLLDIVPMGRAREG